MFADLRSSTVVVRKKEGTVVAIVVNSRCILLTQDLKFLRR